MAFITGWKEKTGQRNVIFPARDPEQCKSFTPTELLFSIHMYSRINNSEEIVNTMSYYVLDFLSNTLTALVLFSGTINTWKLERFIYFERIIEYHTIA